MSRSREDDAARAKALEEVLRSGRALSDAIVLFHAGAADAMGMGASEWKALGLIAQHGPLSHRDLVDRMGLKPASVTNILDRLQAGGWIARQRSSADARSIEITADEARLGELRGRIFGPLMRRLGEVYDRYTLDELRLIADALSRIADAQQAAAEEIGG